MRLLTFAILAIFATCALAEYPDKPVRLIVPYPAGGPTDVIGRNIAQRLADSLKQAFVIENRGGANGIIGMEAVAKAEPDGYTLAFTVDSTLTANPTLYKKLPYNAQKDYAPVSVAASLTTFVLAVHPSVPADTLAKFRALAAAKPRGMTMANAGNASPAHLVAALFEYTSHAELTPVPYKGGAPAVADLVGGQVNAMFVPATNAGPLVKSGKLKALAVTSTKRFVQLPDVPTFAEAGLPEFDLNKGFWYAILAPAGTPEPVIASLNAAVVSVLAIRELRDALAKFGVETLGTTPAEARALTEADTKRWAEVIRANRIQLD
jgi:tripartite-type tricarboxylate transporter receptor subunit TctC